MVSRWIVGLVVLPPTILLCLVAPGRTRRARRIWRRIALIDALALLWIVFDVGARLHDVGEKLAGSEALYGVRREYQIVAMAAVGAVALLTTLVVTWQAGRLGRRIAVAALATLAMVLLILVEAISLHQTDAILFRRIGPMLAVSWALIACALATSAAALSARRR